jgi:hypothetical protein
VKKNVNRYRYENDSIEEFDRLMTSGELDEYKGDTDPIDW